jgi:peptidoglycan/LPS O-acetylase OafA/YrhL
VARKPHIREIDLVRALTVLGVISVHTTWFTNIGQDFWPSFAMDALHYTREVFLFMTAFVLFYTYYDRRIALGSWWLRRFKLVGIPYVVWSAAYLIYGGHLAQGLGAYFKTLGLDLLTGVAWFHLYYLLVTLQIYLVFPLFVWLVRKTAGHHRWLLAGSFLVELGLMALAEYDAGLGHVGGVLGTLWGYRGQIFLTYQFYLVLGALAAVHLDRLYDVVWAHWRWILGGFLASLAGMWGLYIWAVDSHYMTPVVASGVLQPMMVPYALFVILGCYAVGVRWSARYDRWPRLSALIVLAAELSFGVYLFHPMILQELTTYVTPLVAAWPRIVVTPLTALTVYALTLAAVRLLSATPLSVWIIGREQMPLRWRWGRAPAFRAQENLKEAQ